MSENPYAAPKTSLADVADDTAPRTRPVQVTVAGVLMWVLFAVGVFGGVQGAQELGGFSGGVIIVVAIVCGLLTLVNVMVMKGRHWARVTYLALFAIGIPRLYGDLEELFAEGMIIGALGIAFVAMQVTALVLLFTAPGKYWFRRVSIMRRLFSYGTLRQEDVQRTLLGRVLEGSDDEIVGFELATSRSGAHLNIVRSERQDSRVGGRVFHVSDAELARADDYEERDGYERIEVMLASGASCWVYTEARPSA